MLDIRDVHQNDSSVEFDQTRRNNAHKPSVTGRVARVKFNLNPCISFDVSAETGDISNQAMPQFEFRNLTEAMHVSEHLKLGV